MTSRTGLADRPALDMREQVEGYIYVTSDGRDVLSADETPVDEAEWDDVLGDEE